MLLQCNPHHGFCDTSLTRHPFAKKKYQNRFSLNINLRSHTAIYLIDIFRLKLEESLKVEHYQFLHEYIFSWLEFWCPLLPPTAPYFSPNLDTRTTHTPHPSFRPIELFVDASSPWFITKNWVVNSDSIIRLDCGAACLLEYSTKRESLRDWI